MKTVDILFIEDNPDEAEMCLMAFNSSLDKITPTLWHVNDGVEALQFIFGNKEVSDPEAIVKIKLIVLDIKMPRLNGFEVMAALKEDSRTKDIPVIFLTSSKEKSDLLKAFNMGAARYIVKPIAFEEYVTTIAEIGDYWKKMDMPLKHERLKEVPLDSK
jgi:two-component system response regulator